MQISVVVNELVMDGGWTTLLVRRTSSQTSAESHLLRYCRQHPYHWLRWQERGEFPLSLLRSYPLSLHHADIQSKHLLDI